MTSGSGGAYVAPASTIILTTVVLVFFFMVFCSVYICRCTRYWLEVRHNRGKHNSTMMKFPTFVYADVKNLQEEKLALECAICLSDFADEDMLRLLTMCRHVFHKKCIDLWLDKNDTCPVCRTNLDSPLKLPPNSTTETGGSTNATSRNEEVRITVERDNENGENRARSVGWEAPASTSTNYLAWERDFRKTWVKKLSKSHSTGHSNQKLTRRTDEDRYTLPEYLHARLISQHSSRRNRSSAREIASPRLGRGGSACFGGNTNSMLGVTSSL